MKYQSGKFLRESSKKLNRSKFLSRWVENFHKEQSWDHKVANFVEVPQVELAGREKVTSGSQSEIRKNLSQFFFLQQISIGTVNWLGTIAIG